MNDIKLVYMYIIGDRKLKAEFIAELNNASAALIDYVHGRGFYEQKGLLHLLGFAGEKHKVVISCLLKKEKADELIIKLNEKYNFKKQDSGIAFTIPVDKLVY